MIRVKGQDENNEVCLLILYSIPFNPNSTRPDSGSGIGTKTRLGSQGSIRSRREGNKQ